MKKFLALLLCMLYLFSLNVSAYSIINVSNYSVKYETEFKQKINFSKINELKLKKLSSKIEVLINKTEEDIKINDEKKEKLLWQLIALSNLINNELKNREIISNLTITIIDDKRCTNCITGEITEQLKRVPFLIWAKYVEKDFFDAWVSDYLKQNEILKLPVVILSTNNINDNWEMQVYLKELKDKQYSLEIWASFDSFAKRSDKWFLVLEKEILNKLKTNTYLKWNKDAKISWVEYSDLECPFCARLYNSDVSKKINETYGGKVNKYFNHFPLEFHKNAVPAANVLECIWEQKWSEGFYLLLDKAFSNEKSDQDYLIAESVKLWADKTQLEKCTIDWKYDKKITDQQSFGSLTFGISWTPASILINNETGEYEFISWAYPFEKFKEVIDKLLK